MSSPDQSDQLLTERVSDATAVVRINRPQQRNALNDYVRTELPRCAERLASQGVRCVVLASTGGKSFAAGADLNELSSMQAADAQEHFIEFNECLDALEDGPIPIIAAMRGWVLGGGVELAAACDLRVAASTSQFGMPIGGLGHSVDIRNMHRLLSHLPPAFVREMLLVDQLFSAAELQRTGFLSRVVPPDAVEDVAISMAEVLGTKAPLGLRTTRQQIVDVLRASGRGNLDPAGLDRAAELFDSEDFHEGVAAFFEKRRPGFRGG